MNNMIIYYYAVPINEWDIQGEYTDGTNILGLACFSLILGFTLGKMGPTGKPLLNVFETLSDVTMMIINHLVLYVHTSEQISLKYC